MLLEQEQALLEQEQALLQEGKQEQGKQEQGKTMWMHHPVRQEAKLSEQEAKLSE